MTDVLDRDLPVERHDVFDVMQLTRGSALESVVAGDLVEVGPGLTSNVHRHNRAETVLYIVSGSADVVVADDVVSVKKGDRIHVGKGVHHGFRTGNESVTFISIQSPPILDAAAGTRDLEPLEQ